MVPIWCSSRTTDARRRIREHPGSVLSTDQRAVQADLIPAYIKLLSCQMLQRSADQNSLRSFFVLELVLCISGRGRGCFEPSNSLVEMAATFLRELASQDRREETEQPS